MRAGSQSPTRPPPCSSSSRSTTTARTCSSRSSPRSRPASSSSSPPRCSRPPSCPAVFATRLGKLESYATPSTSSAAPGDTAPRRALEDRRRASSARDLVMPWALLLPLISIPFLLATLISAILTPFVLVGTLVALAALARSSSDRAAGAARSEGSRRGAGTRARAACRAGRARGTSCRRRGRSPRSPRRSRRPRSRTSPCR